MDEVEAIAMREKPKMILAGFSAYSRSLDWKRFREIADKVGAFLFADIAHIAGLIAGKQLENPMPFCDVVSTTTHKTLRGPRGAMIMCTRAIRVGDRQGCFSRRAGRSARSYQRRESDRVWRSAQAGVRRNIRKQVIKNAQALAAALAAKGYRIISGGTDNHLMLVDIFGSKNITGKEAEKTFEHVGISINKNMIPFDPRKPLDPSGIRLGTPALTTRGCKEK